VGKFPEPRPKGYACIDQEPEVGRLDEGAHGAYPKALEAYW